MFSNHHIQIVEKSHKNIVPVGEPTRLSVETKSGVYKFSHQAAVDTVTGQEYVIVESEPPAGQLTRRFLRLQDMPPDSATGQ